VYIEFIDLLRCIEPHEESQLVAALNRVDGRHVIEAKLGCPVCGAEIFIENEVAIFDDTAAFPPPILLDDSHAMRISAFLDLIAPGKVVLLAGDFARVAASIAESAGARVIALNSPSPAHLIDDVAEIRASSRIPLASKSLDGIAFDESHATPELLTEAARLLKPGGRLYVKWRGSLLPQFRELARSENETVAELVGDLVSLKPRS
jgi:SAM-dependent methyltransferase